MEMLRLRVHLCTKNYRLFLIRWVKRGRVPFGWHVSGGMAVEGKIEAGFRGVMKGEGGVEMNEVR